MSRSYYTDCSQFYWRNAKGNYVHVASLSDDELVDAMVTLAQLNANDLRIAVGLSRELHKRKHGKPERFEIAGAL